MTKYCSKFIVMILIVTLSVTMIFPDNIYGEESGKKDVNPTDMEQIEDLTNEPESKKYDGYTVKITNGISKKMANEIDDSSSSEQITQKFVQVDNPEDALEFANPGQIEYIEPNYYIYPDEVKGNAADVISEHPDDPQYGSTYIDVNTSTEAFKYNQWNLEMVKAESAWKEGLRGRGVKVGFIDTGFNKTHQDMYSGRVLSGKLFSDTGISNNVTDTKNHGTKVASVLYSSINNNLDIAGIADMVSILPLKVGNTTDLPTGANVVQAIKYAQENGIQVINMSMGMDFAYKPLEEQINYFALGGGIFVTSGGNQNRVAPRYPAACYNSVAVGGVTKTGERWYDGTKGSNYNSSIEVMAPAKTVRHIAGTGTGTSYASPHVAALAAIAKQYSGGKINITEFKDLLHKSADDKGDPGRDDYYGYGLVNYENFLNLITKDNSNGTATILPYPITYMKNGGTLSGSYENFYYGDANVKLPTIKRTGYTFQGWYTTSNFSGAKQTYIYAGNTGAKTFYAKWKAKSYKVKFNVNKGKKIKTKSKTVTYNSEIGKLPTPKRNKYKFAGWYTKKKGGTQYSRYKKYTNSKGITLYARWTKNNTITFYPNGGKVSKQKHIIKKGKKVGALPTPTRSGYTFKGWFTKKSGGSKWTKKTYVKKAKNRKLYAHWKKK